MAVKQIYMDSCLTSWKNKINRSHIVLRGECVAMQALVPSLPLTKTPLADLSVCVQLVSFASAAGKSLCSLQFPFLPPNLLIFRL